VLQANHHPNELSTSGNSLSAHGIFILNTSKRCESNALLFSQALIFFVVNGYQISRDIDRCSIILINTCCVSEDKIETSLSALALAKPYAEQKQIVLLGCLATLPTERLERHHLICIGPKDLTSLDNYFEHHVSIHDIPVNHLPPELFTSGQGLGGRDYYILIAQGCSNHCSYCNIKRAKGSVRSEPIVVICDQVRRGLSRGVREFSFLADDCGSYGDDIGTDLLQLIETVLRIAPDFTLKLLYIYPDFLHRRFGDLERIFQSGRIGYAHIPVQSGSQRLLNLMSRNYDIAAVMSCISQLRNISPQTKLVTHILVNFPTETEEDFLASLAVAAAFDDSIFLQFSENQETGAAILYPKVTGQEANARLDAASRFVNQRVTGSGCVISDFNCTTPYNILKGQR
jgi:MiaB/RimO family radical SAM methylthiotransferase